MIGIIYVIICIYTYNIYFNSVVLLFFGAFSEYKICSPKHLIKVPSCDPEILSLITSGLTASLSLEYVGDMKSKETVLVTAAAGGKKI